MGDLLLVVILLNVVAPRQGQMICNTFVVSFQLWHDKLECLIQVFDTIIQSFRNTQRCSTQFGRLSDLLTQTRLGRKCLKQLNTLAYFVKCMKYKIEMLHHIGPSDIFRASKAFHYQIFLAKNVTFNDGWTLLNQAPSLAKLPHLPGIRVAFKKKYTCFYTVEF